MRIMKSQKRAAGFRLTLFALLLALPMAEIYPQMLLPQRPQERKTLTAAGSVEAPFMSIYFPLPSFAFSTFFNVGDFNIGIKAGSATPWLLGHIGNADQSKTWFLPLFYIEPLEVRHVFFNRVLIGGSIGYRMFGGTKGELSPVLPVESKYSDRDGSYNFTVREWYAKAYLGISLNGNAAHTGVVVAEIGGMWSLDRSEEYSYKVDPQSKDKERLAKLTATGFENHLADNLPNFKDNVHRNVFPFQYVYVAVRFNFAGL